MKKIIYLLLIILLALFSSCAKICIVQSVSTSINGTTVSFIDSKIPCEKVEDYESAVKQSINAIYSKEFEKELNRFMTDSIESGDHVDAWKNENVECIIQRMRRQINGQYVETYGGIIGWFKYRFSHNIAYDGEIKGAILMNRIPLKHRNSASIANTIAHETAHRIGLTHPHSNKNFEIAAKEPPYVIGNIIERLIKRDTRLSIAE